MTLHKKTKETRDDIINHASSSKTTEKSSANLLKQTQTSYEIISKKEVQIEGLVNEISRVKIDNMNSDDQNRKLQEKLNELPKCLLKRKDSMKVKPMKGSLKLQCPQIKKLQTFWILKSKVLSHNKKPRLL